MASNDFSHLPPELQLLAGFRNAFHHMESRVNTSLRESYGDTIIFERLEDELNELLRLARSNFDVFPPGEGIGLETNVLMGQVRQARQHAVDASHHGHPIVIEIEKT
ncbi:hypothetical protein FRC02_005092 [Tulasnella sp. 418]|nr:hypothetical protein FRC02_005092 [Tulasnella sp. 418]